MIKCEFCSIPIDKGCVAMQVNAIFEGYCEVCDDYIGDYNDEEDDNPGAW